MGRFFSFGFRSFHLKLIHKIFFKKKTCGAKYLLKCLLLCDGNLIQVIFWIGTANCYNTTIKFNETKKAFCRVFILLEYRLNVHDLINTIDIEPGFKSMTWFKLLKIKCNFLQELSTKQNFGPIKFKNAIQLIEIINAWYFFSFLKKTQTTIGLLRENHIPTGLNKQYFGGEQRFLLLNENESHILFLFTSIIIITLDINRWIKYSMESRYSTDTALNLCKKILPTAKTCDLHTHGFKFKIRP